MEWVLLLAILALCPLIHLWMMKKGGKEGGEK